MRLGFWGARANNAGLGTQALEFWRHVRPEATALVDYSHIDGKVSFPDRYAGDPGVTHFHGAPSDREIETWLDTEQLDCVVTMETPYNPHLYTACRARGVATFCQYNFEFLRYLQPGGEGLPLPDVLMAPTPWCVDRVQAQLGRRAWVRYLPVPVATDRFPARPARRVRRFLHIGGYKLHADRNGTEALLRAIPQVKAQDIEFTIFSQHEVPHLDDPRVQVCCSNLLHYWDLYQHGDCLLLPRRYGGLCLPAQEAAAAGLVLVMPDCLPNTSMCHPRATFPVHGLDETEGYPVATVDPGLLALQIDCVAEWGAADVAEVISYQRARVHAWADWAPHYREFFASHCGS